MRRLRHQFGHFPRKVLINFSVQLVAKRMKTPVRNGQHTRPSCLGTTDSITPWVLTCMLEVIDIDGAKIQVLNICGDRISIGACCAGQCSSGAFLKALQDRWFSWAGHPAQIICDRGLHNRGVLQKYMDERNIPVFHTSLESPDGIGRVERHGGLLKGMYRKICREIQIHGRAQVEIALSQACLVKNEQNRVGGFSPSQWVLVQWAQPGAIEAKYDSKYDPSLQRQARMEAHKAFVHLDCSRRVQKALLRNASTI